MSGKYQFRFNVCGLILFLMIMLPNIIWFFVPAPNDVLRSESITPYVDMVASICQVMMALFLCCTFQRISSPIMNEVNARKKGTIFSVASIIFCILYFAGWVLYYTGMTSQIIIYGLTVCPCIAFLLFEIGKNNWLALIPTVVFTICHIYYAIMNF